MGTWSTTAPTNLASEWTAMQENSAQGGYRVKISGNYVYLYYNCRVRACSAWLETGQLCVKVENYSFATGSASPGNSLSTNAYVTNENGVKVYADANTTNMGDSSETAHGHSRGTYYYTYDADFTVKRNKGKFSIRCGKKAAIKVLNKLDKYIPDCMSYKTFR